MVNLAVQGQLSLWPQFEVPQKTCSYAAVFIQQGKANSQALSAILRVLSCIYLESEHQGKVGCYSRKNAHQRRLIWTNPCQDSVPLLLWYIMGRIWFPEQ